MDDNIIYFLNKIDLRKEDHNHLDCETIFKRFTKLWEYRHDKIQDCIKLREKQVEILKEKADQDPKDISKLANYTQQKRALSFLRDEEIIERVTINRSMSLFKRKCKGFEFKM